MALETLRDLLRHQLGDLYHAEQQMIVLLDEVELETSTTLVRDRIRAHRHETMRQLDTLERCFELVGAAAPRVESAMVHGVRADRAAFLAAQPTALVLEMFNLHVAARLAHYAAAGYRLIAALAQLVDHDDVRRLLERSLAVELDLAAWIAEHALAQPQADSLPGRQPTPARRAPRAAALSG